MPYGTPTSYSMAWKTISQSRRHCYRGWNLWVFFPCCVGVGHGIVNSHNVAHYNRQISDFELALDPPRERRTQKWSGTWSLTIVIYLLVAHNSSTRLLWEPITTMARPFPTCSIWLCCACPLSSLSSDREPCSDYHNLEPLCGAAW